MAHANKGAFWDRVSHGKASEPKDALPLVCGPAGFHTHIMLCLTKSLVSSTGAVFPKGQSTITGIKLGATQRGQHIDACYFTALRLWECLCTYPCPQIQYFLQEIFLQQNITSLHLCCNLFINDHFSKNEEMLCQRELRNPISILLGFTRSYLIYQARLEGKYT